MRRTCVYPHVIIWHQTKQLAKKRQRANQNSVCANVLMALRHTGRKHSSENFFGSLSLLFFVCLSACLPLMPACSSARLSVRPPSCSLILLSLFLHHLQLIAFEAGLHLDPKSGGLCQLEELGYVLMAIRLALSGGKGREGVGWGKKYETGNAYDVKYVIIWINLMSLVKNGYGG